MSSCPIFFCDPLEDKIVGTYHSEYVEGLFVFRPVAASTSSRSPISGLSTKRLTSTLNDILYYFLKISACLVLRINTQ
jgi:hypothetical protein